MNAVGLTHSHTPISMRLPIKLFVAAGAMILAAEGLAMFPGVVNAVFMGGAARLASLLSGAAVTPMDEGWALAFAGQPVLVTEACRATDFYLMATAVIGWHLAARLRWWPLAPLCAALAAVPLTVCVNALRVIAVAQAHRWVIPRLPEPYEPFLHMLTGAAVFLPALIGLNVIFESYGRTRNTGPASA